MDQKPSSITVLKHEKYLFLEISIFLIFPTKKPFPMILSLILKPLYSVRGSWRITRRKWTLQKVRTKLLVLENERGIYHYLKILRGQQKGCEKLLILTIAI